mmetsp:Transcript_54248/g.126287  ORF Transcript_54248/g.126287 Transcript_54248/m.126287 type:complete len:230 (-) Transcript_54248:1085-1774(-)
MLHVLCHFLLLLLLFHSGRLQLLQLLLGMPLLLGYCLGQSLFSLLSLGNLLAPHQAPLFALLALDFLGLLGFLALPTFVAVLVCTAEPLRAQKLLALALLLCTLAPCQFKRLLVSCSGPLELRAFLPDALQHRLLQMKLVLELLFLLPLLQSLLLQHGVLVLPLLLCLLDVPPCRRGCRQHTGAGGASRAGGGRSKTGLGVKFFRPGSHRTCAGDCGGCRRARRWWLGC